jgi:HlyD family secretion protein
MKRKPIIAIALVAVIATVAVFVHRAAFARETTTYRFTTVERGNIEATVSATGSLRAVTTVAVGTQVSGQISELFIDFNDTVKKGQLLARIDPKLQQQAVTDAAASVERARAQYLQAQREYNRSRELMSAGLVARSEFETTDSSLDVARANVTSAQVALDRAKQNLEYTNIYAPIDGVVVERNIDLGQTVAASLSAPQLFLIANDLEDMQILANVGESDIASIKEGQKVKFTVQALQGRTFEGEVRQVRLQSATNENVVNYTVVVSVANPRKVLLPGMTARVEFLTASAENVRTRGGTLYVLDDKGAPKAIRIRIGLTDGSTTEVRGEGLTAGMKVIADTAQAQTAESGSSSSPFSGTQRQQGGARPGGF